MSLSSKKKFVYGLCISTTESFNNPNNFFNRDLYSHYGYADLPPYRRTLGAQNNADEAHLL